MRVMAAKLALAPLLIWQGRRVRAQALRLPEAAGPRAGQEGEPTSEAPLRLLIVGDSSAAGVGAPTQQDALAGRLAQALARRLARPVHWRVHACTGHTAADSLRALQQAELAPADLAVTALGVNDVTGQVGVHHWLAALDRLDAELRERAGVAYVLHCAVPPMQQFSLLPQPLRWWMGLEAARFNHRLRQHLAGQPARGLLALPDGLHRPGGAQGLMAEDGFHPGPAGYAVWAEALAQDLAPRVAALTAVSSA